MSLLYYKDIPFNISKLFYGDKAVSALYYKDKLVWDFRKEPLPPAPPQSSINTPTLKYFNISNKATIDSFSVFTHPFEYTDQQSGAKYNMLDYFADKTDIGVSEGSVYLVNDSNNYYIWSNNEAIRFNTSLDKTFGGVKNAKLSFDTIGTDPLIEQQGASFSITPQRYLSRAELDGVFECVESMFNTFNYAEKLSGRAYCPPFCTNMTNAFLGCYNLTGPADCGAYVETMYGAYAHCRNLGYAPVCGNNVVNMQLAYSNCRNLVGSPVIGPNVEDASYAYNSCISITGTGYSDAYTSAYTFNGCSSLKTIVFGNVVKNVQNAANGCASLKTITFGANITNAQNCCAGCNFLADAYFEYSTATQNFKNIFGSRTYSNVQLNIHVPEGSTQMQALQSAYSDITGYGSYLSLNIVVMKD